MGKTAIFWFRRDLRLDDNTGLRHALNSRLEVLPIFIFDPQITGELPADDARITFIYKELKKINTELNHLNSSIKIYQGDPITIWEKIVEQHEIKEVYYNKDYEPYAIERDQKITEFLNRLGIKVSSFKDQVLFEEGEIVKDDGKPYTVFTPYKNKYLQKLKHQDFFFSKKNNSDKFYKKKHHFPELDKLGFIESKIPVKNFDLSNLTNYALERDIPSLDATSYLSPHLRFGTVSIRKVFSELRENEVFLSELIWREFFMQILFHFPQVVNQNFKPRYDRIPWINNEKDFEKWCRGETGYPLVDAGMKQLNQSGYMHNRIRMLTASFLCKHLLIDWRWGEAYFAKKLLDYELSSNNGNWQWAAGSGCDAAPYFRIFNPTTQQQKFDPDYKYIKKWIPDFSLQNYISPIIEHKFARERTLKIYKSALL